MVDNVVNDIIIYKTCQLKKAEYFIQFIKKIRFYEKRLLSRKKRYIIAKSMEYGVVVAHRPLTPMV